MSGKVTGHFTQLVWAETSLVGCGRTKSDKEVYIICNYGEGGNVAGSPVYKFGTACSECENGVDCNKDYPGLCGPAEIKKDFDPPFRRFGLVYEECFFKTLSTYFTILNKGIFAWYFC